MLVRVVSLVIKNSLHLPQPLDIKITFSVGYGRNKAIAASTGSYLCFQDVDDEMLPGRLLKQYQLAKQYKNAVNKYKGFKYHY